MKTPVSKIKFLARALCVIITGNYMLLHVYKFPSDMYLYSRICLFLVLKSFLSWSIPTNKAKYEADWRLMSH